MKIHNKNIVLLFDNNNILEHIKSMLEINDFKNVTNSSIEKVLLEKPDLVILQESYNDLNTYDNCKKIKSIEDLKNTPIIIISEEKKLNTLLIALEAQADNYFIYPVNEDEFINRITYSILETELINTGASEIGLSITINGKKVFISQKKIQVLEQIFSLLDDTLERNSTLKEANSFLMNLQYELEKKNIELKKLNEQKSDILAVSARDLREPLGIIWRYSNSFLKKFSDSISKEQKESISVIKNYSSYMLDIVSNILLFFDIMKLDIQERDLAELIQENIISNQALANENKISINFKYETNKSYLAKIDKDKIIIVLNNLISNAIKFSFENNIIDILLTKEHDNLVVCIRDYGYGIPFNNIETLFKPFQKFTTSNNENLKGSGLGLACVKKIVSAHHGKVWVESEVESGSKFYFSLPIY